MMASLVRARRRAYLGQNLYLAATSMGLGAFKDDEINRMLGADGIEEAAIYMLAVGKT